MFTANWYKALAVGISGVYASLTSTNGGTNVSIYDTTTVSNKIYNAFQNGVRTSYTGGSNQSTHIVLGTGNVPPSLSDYKLSGDVVSGIAASTSFSGSRASDGTYEQGGVVMTITNNNTTDITIGEVGIVYQNNSYAALFERTALDSLITIPAGGIGQVTYTIRVNHPVA